MGKHNRPVDSLPEVVAADHAPVKLKKHKKHKDKHDSAGDASPSTTTDVKASKSSAKKRKRDNQDQADKEPCNHDVSPSDDTHTNLEPKTMDNTSPSSPTPQKKHKKHKHSHPQPLSPKGKAEEEITLAEMLLEDREKEKKREAKAAEAKRKQEELEEREAAAALAEKEARKARKAERKERKKREVEAKEGRSRSAPETGSNTPADGGPERGKKKKKKAKRSSSEGGDVITSVDGGSVKVSEQVDDRAKDEGGEKGKPKATTVDDVAERWNIGGLEGGSQRQSKFMRLLGAKKAGIAPTAKQPAGKGSTDRVADELERQFEYGRKMKHESGGQKRGLGSA